MEEQIEFDAEVFELFAEELPREADLAVGIPQCVITPPQCVIYCYPPEEPCLPPFTWDCMPQCVIA